MKPTPDEIEAVIAGMVGVGPLGCGDPDEAYVPLAGTLFCWFIFAQASEKASRGPA